MAVDVYFLLDVRIEVEGELLGTTWEIPFALAPCALHLPRRSPGDVHGGPLIGPDFGGLEEELERRERSGMTEDELFGFDMWGGISSWNKDEDRVLAAHIARAVAVCRYDGSDDADERLAFANAANDALGPWLVRVVDWLEVIAGKVLGEPSATVEPADSSSPEPLEVVNGKPQRFVRQSHSIRVTIHESASVSRDSWAAAAQYVAAGAQVPLPHDLLREARRSRRRADSRRAVIDAASACEVALSDVIRKHLGGTPLDAVERQFARMSGVVELFDFHALTVRPIGSVSHGRLADQLAGVRNRVAHAGVTPPRLTR